MAGRFPASLRGSTHRSGTRLLPRSARLALLRRRGLLFSRVKTTAPMPALTALVAALTLVFTGTAVASTDSCYTREGCTEKARSAKDFTASAGINTHLGYSQSIYWQDWPMIRDRLLELGVSHIRDGTFAVSYPEIIAPTIAARYNELNAAGIKGNLLVGHEQAMTATTLAQRLAWIKANVADFTTSIEGSNEFDTQGANADRIQSLRAMQCDIYQRVKADPVLMSKPVIGPSSGNFYSDDIWYNEIGDLSACLDKGNLHNYPGADAPHRRLNRDLSVGMSWARNTYGDKPLWATEFGYWNTTGTNGVSEAAAATYTPRAFMENFRRGIERSQGYELIDLNTGSNQVIDNYGLLRTDGTRKPAFTALRNLLRIVKDPLPASGRLGFGIVCTANCRYGDPDAYPTHDGPIRHVLLKHSTGAYYLAVWSESTVWDPAARTDTPKAAQSFSLHLHEAPAKVEIFDPNDATTPLTTDTSGSQTVNTAAPDTLRLIKITPRARLPRHPKPRSSVTADPDGSADSESSPTPRRRICRRPKAVKRIAFSKVKYTNVRAHYVRAVRRGWPRILVLNRKGAKQRRDKLLRKKPTRAGRDRAQYPPAIGRGRGSRPLKRGSKPAGWLADVKYVPASEGRSHRLVLETTLKRFCDGTRFRYSFK